MTIQIRNARDERDVRGALQIYLDDDAAWRLHRYGEAAPLTEAEIEDEFEYWWNIYDSAPDGFFVAEDDERALIVGIASSVRRPPQWMLTNFFVHPDYKGHGLGHQLLQRAHAVRDGCDRFCVHASDDPAAQALYMRFGMYPQPHSTQFTGQIEQRLDVPDHLKLEKVSALNALDTIAALDRSALGFERVVDHRFWAEHGLYYLVRAKQDLLGYFRVGQSPSQVSDIGPVVVTEDRWMGDVLQAVLAVAQTVSNRQRLLVPGANTTAIAKLLAWGYRCHDVELLMSSAPLPGLPRVLFQDTDLL